MFIGFIRHSFVCLRNWWYLKNEIVLEERSTTSLFRKNWNFFISFTLPLPSISCALLWIWHWNRTSIVAIVTDQLFILDAVGHRCKTNCNSVKRMLEFIFLLNLPSCVLLCVASENHECKCIKLKINKLRSDDNLDRFTKWTPFCKEIV